MYRTGVPLTHDELPKGELAIDDGSPAVLRSKSPPRTVKTDANGCFELVMEPLSLNTKVRFRKEGWYESIVVAMDMESDPVELRRGEYELAGQLLNEEGAPVVRFRLLVTRSGGTGIGGLGETLSEQTIENAEGRFRVFSTKPFLNYMLRADGYSPLHVGSYEDPPRPLTNHVKEALRLSRGVSLFGTIETTTQHTRETSVFLIDLRYCDSLRDLDSPKSVPLYSDDGLVVSEGTGNRIQYESRLGSDGRYAFENLATGRYALLVQYGNQTVAVRPIEVGSENVSIPKIALPALGSLKGIVKERRTLSTQPIDAETIVKPFTVYALHRGGDPFGLPFRTDHLGEFMLESIPVGAVTIGLSSFGASFSDFSEVLCFPQVIQKGETSIATADTVVLCVMLVEENRSLWMDRVVAKVHGASETIAFVERDSEQTRDGFQKYFIHGSSALSSGFYTAEIKDGPIQFQVDFEYRRNQAPPNIVLSHRWLNCNATRENSGSMGGFKATIIRNKRPISSVYLPFDSEDTGGCLVESAGPFDVLIHDFTNGFALRKNVSFASQTVDLGDVVWNPGARLFVKVNLSGLDVFPDEISIRHEETGISFSEVWSWDSDAEFASLPPGKWLIEVTSTDPLLGKRILVNREIELVQSEEVHLELHR
jgi:hypothetical protein